MLPLSLFRERNFAVGNTATFTTYLGLGAVLFLLPLFLQQIAGYTPVQAGIASAVNNTLTRVSILVAVAAFGAVVSAAFASSVDAAARVSPLDAAGRAAVARAKREPLGGASVDGVGPGERARLRLTLDD